MTGWPKAFIGLKSWLLQVLSMASAKPCWQKCTCVWMPSALTLELPSLGLQLYATISNYSALSFFCFCFFSSAFWIGFCWNCMECQTTFQALMPGPCNERWGWRIKSLCCWSTGFVRACEKKQRWKLWSTRSRYSLISGALLTSLGWVQCFMVFGWWRKLAAGCSFCEGTRKHGVRNGTLPRFSPVV